MQDRPDNKDLGSVLLELGRITDKDIERALEHQRIQGGYFGQALVDLGIVSEEELDFGLAAQAKLPYIVPDPDHIDAEVAGLVPPSWAERHNAIPIKLEDGWLTLVVDSPLKSGLADQLARRTGVSVKLALCTSRLVRDAVRQVYKLGPVREKARQVLSMEAFWTLASSPSASCWGLSVRQDLVTGWIERDGGILRHSLVHNWQVFLDRLLSPPPSQVLPGHGLRQWRASVRPDQSPVAVTVTSLSGPGGHDLLFEPIREADSEVVELPAASALATLREALGRGRVVIAARSPTGQAARSLVTRLPRLLLKPGHRSVCVFHDGSHAISEDLLVVTRPEDGGDEKLLAFLERLGLDAVGLEISMSSRDLWDRALSLAPLTLLVLDGDPDEPAPPGVDWLLCSDNDRQPEWTLRQA